MNHPIEYYEFPNGEIVKSVKPNGVYRYHPIDKTWNIDHSLTAYLHGIAHMDIHAKTCVKKQISAVISLHFHRNGNFNREIRF